MEDTQIVDLFLARDEKAIKEISNKYAAFCSKIAWNILTNREDTEECVNDTWMAVWQCIPPKRPDKLPAFLCTITRGLAIDYLRKKCAAKRPDTHMIAISKEVGELDVMVSNSLEEHIEHKEIVRVINEFLKEIPSKDRDIFIHRYFWVDSLKNIANRHHMSVGAVKQNLLRTRKKLQKRLNEEEIL